eukprot:TRINITY_DN6138_c0_g1_i1.p1 TRINITY_DN6138_c0_g1~~TRINITY_DN6138_c0_g1_i1.p1  ORF type:complete len:209 (+),score=64.39 TRINITY_DN6138_c0_g1_i1:1033-1659(+)
MSEQVTENNGLELGPCEAETTADLSVDAEKAALLESTRKLLEQSSQKVHSAVTETKDQKDRFEVERAQAQEMCNGSEVVLQQNGHIESPEQPVVKVKDILNSQTKEEMEEINQRRKYETEMREKEQILRLEKRKQWDEEEKQRLAREKERKLKREQASKENLKREREKRNEKKKKELKKKKNKGNRNKNIERRRTCGKKPRRRETRKK